MVAPSPPPPSPLSLPRAPPRVAEGWPRPSRPPPPSDYVVPVDEPLSPQERGALPRDGSGRGGVSDSRGAGRTKENGGSESWDARRGGVDDEGDRGGKRGCGELLYGLLGFVAGFLLSFFAFLFLCPCCACCGPMFGGERARPRNRRAFAIGAAVGMVLSIAASVVLWRYRMSNCYSAGGRVFCY